LCRERVFAHDRRVNGTSHPEKSNKSASERIDKRRQVRQGLHLHSVPDMHAASSDATLSPGLVCLLMKEACLPSGSSSIERDVRLRHRREIACSTPKSPSLLTFRNECRLTGRLSKTVLKEFIPSKTGCVKTSIDIFSSTTF
jgi:hypothetical protein